jgi:hypothetical protein
VRAMFIPPNTRVNSRMLANRFVYGWTLNQFGTPVRAIFAECAPGPDGLPDGCGDYFPSTATPNAEAGTWQGINKILGPMKPENSDPALCAEMRHARRATAENWMLFSGRQAAEEARRQAEAAEEADRQAAEREQREAAEAAEAAKAALITPRPKTKPKPHWFLQLLGSK